LIRRLFTLALLAWLAVWWWRRFVASAAARSRTGTDANSRHEPARELGPMVRDRVCNTFLPRSRALSLRAGGEEHFFCSAACRAKFLERSEIRSA